MREEITKKAILLSSLSSDNYRLLFDLVAPDKPKDDMLTFHAIVQKMKEHTKPEKSQQLARYEFDNLARNSGERVADFVARLKHLSFACKFTPDERPARLKDRFIAGLQDQKMVSAILRIKFEDIMFVNAVETASAVEQSLKDVRAIAGQTMGSDTGINKMSHSPRTPQATFGMNRGQPSQHVRSGGEVNTQACWGSAPPSCVPL